MATNRYKSGEVWDYTTGATFSSGDAVEVKADELVGIALDDIANGSVGPVATVGVFSVTKAAGTAWTIGMDIYFDGTEFVTIATSNTWAGKAFLAAASGAVAGYLDLNKGAGLVSTGDIADESVTTAKMADLARGSLLSGQGVTNHPTALAAEGDGEILVGDGTDVAAVAVSGDVTLANTGAVTIAAEAVTLAKTADLAQGSLISGQGSDRPGALDAKTDAQILIGDGTDVVSVAVSGDATLANTGALTIAAAAVEATMLADLAQGSLLSGQASNRPTALDAKTDAQILIGDGTDVVSVAVSGDATIANTGAVTIAAAAVENSMLANLAQGSLLSGQGSNRPGAIDAKTDAQILVGDGTDVNSVAVSGDVTIANTGAVTIAALAVETGMIAADAVDATKIADDAVSAEHLDDGILPSHVVKYAGEWTWAGSGTGHAETVTGALATDIVVGSIQTVPSQAGYLVSLAVTDNTVTATLSAANSSNDAVISYVVYRAVV